MQIEQEFEDLPLHAGAIESAAPKVAATLNRLAFTGFLVVLALTAIPYGTVEPWWESLFVCITFVLVALRVLEGLLSREWRLSNWSILAPLCAIALLALIQILPTGGITGSTISADPKETQRFIFKFLAVILGGELLLRYTSSERRLRRVVQWVLGVGVVSAVFGIVRFVLQSNSPEILSTFLSADVGYGQFVNRNHFALLMEMSLGLLLGMVIKGGVPRSHAHAYWVAIGLVWMALVTTSSRGGVLSMIGLLVYVAVVHRLTRKRGTSGRSRSDASGRARRVATAMAINVALVAGLILVAAVGVVWVGGDPVVNRMETVQGELIDDTEHIQRIDIWKSTWLLIKANPVMGVGFGGYQSAITEYDRAAGSVSLQQAHNDYLEIVANGGIVGACLAVCFIFVVVRRTLGTLNSTSGFRRAACFGASAGLFAVALHSVVDFGLHLTINALIFSALVVIATANIPDGRQQHAAGEITPV